MIVQDKISVYHEVWIKTESSAKVFVPQNNAKKTKCTVLLNQIQSLDVLNLMYAFQSF